MLDYAGKSLHTFTVPSKSQFHCDVRASFAKAFGNWRRKHKLPLKIVARDLGLSIATVSMWESGQRFPTGGNFERLVEYTVLRPPSPQRGEGVSPMEPLPRSKDQAISFEAGSGFLFRT